MKEEPQDSEKTSNLLKKTKNSASEENNIRFEIYLKTIFNILWILNYHFFCFGASGRGTT